jgi:hypothetical protein
MDCDKYKKPATPSKFNIADAAYIIDNGGGNKIYVDSAGNFYGSDGTKMPYRAQNGKVYDTDSGSEVGS